MFVLSNYPLVAKGVEGFQPDPEISEKVAAVIEEELRAGRYTLEQLEASAARIDKLKKILQR